MKKLRKTNLSPPINISKNIKNRHQTDLLQSKSQVVCEGPAPGKKQIATILPYLPSPMALWEEWVVKTIQVGTLDAVLEE